MSALRTVLAAVLILAAPSAFAAEPKQMSVTVKETQIRATMSYLGKILGVLAYGDRVTIVAEQSGWAKVTLPSGKGEGWVNLSALTAKRIVLKSGSETVASGASSGEVALAGKGFNKEVEAQYRSEKDLDYSWVDRMETYTASPTQVLAFLQQGGLSQGGTP